MGQRERAHRSPAVARPRDAQRLAHERDACAAGIGASGQGLGGVEGHIQDVEVFVSTF